MIRTDENTLRDKIKPYLCEPFSPLSSQAESSQVGLNLFHAQNPAELNGYTRKTISDYQCPHCALTTFSQRATRIIRTRSTSRAIVKESFLPKYIRGDKESGHNWRIKK